HHTARATSPDCDHDVPCGTTDHGMATSPSSADDNHIAEVSALGRSSTTPAIAFLATLDRRRSGRMGTAGHAKVRSEPPNAVVTRGAARSRRMLPEGHSRGGTCARRGLSERDAQTEAVALGAPARLRWG